MPAADTATTACPDADWRCMHGLVADVGSAVVGPAKDSSTRIVGITVPSQSEGGKVTSFWFRLSRPGGGEPAVLTQLAQPWPDLPQEIVHDQAIPVTVNGSTGLFADHPTLAVLAWNQGGRGLQLAIRKSPGSPLPTEAELTALAKSLVVYQP